MGVRIAHVANPDTRPGPQQLPRQRVAPGDRQGRHRELQSPSGGELGILCCQYEGCWHGRVTLKVVPTLAPLDQVYLSMVKFYKIGGDRQAEAYPARLVAGGKGLE